MEESIFTKIIKGDIPSHKIYEDDQVIAFLDVAPYTPGHTLVVPKEQTDHLWDVGDELYVHLMKVVKQVAIKQKEVLKPPRVGLALEGFAVPHAHVHVFPMYQGLEETMNNQAEKPTQEELAEMAKKLSF
jgi:histidine triad (HIT) family protein